MKPLMAMFHAGLVVTVGLAVVGQRHPTLLAALPWAGAVHVLLIFAIGRSDGDLLVTTLHKTGFIDSLIGMAVAFLDMAGRGLAGTDEATLAVASIGTAVIPHALAVWLGHAVEGAAIADPSVEGMRRTLREESNALTEMVREMRGCLEVLAKDLADECSKTLRSTGELLNVESQRFADFLETMRARMEAMARTVPEKLGDGVTEGLRVTMARVQKDTDAALAILPAIRLRFEDLAKAMGDDIIQHSKEAVTRSAEAMKELERTARAARDGVEQVRECAARMPPALREISRVLEQIVIVQMKITSLLESALFREDKP